MSSRLDRIGDWAKRAREANYKLSAVATGLGVTSRHLRRYFWTRFRLSPKDWLRQHRMDEARSLLETDHSVKEVASIVGFQNSTHFSRAFKRSNGVAPGDYSHRTQSCAERNVPSGSEMSDLGPCSRLLPNEHSTITSPSAQERTPDSSL